MKQLLIKLIECQKLTFAESKSLMYGIAQNEVNDAQIAAILTAFLIRPISIEELRGFREALIELAIRVNLNDGYGIDLCGTGGDGKDTFNISTLTTFVLAGAGIKIAKHGNYGVSSTCGSSNILEHFGYKFSTDSDKLKNEIDKSGVCFLHAPLFNPAMKNVAPVRRALKIKTFFNMLGPMVNPSFPSKQLIGVYSLELARLYNYLYQQSSMKYMIIFSLDGYDEVSLTSDFKYILNGVEQIVSPETLNYKRSAPSELSGGKSVPEAASVFIKILKGEGTRAQNDVVTVNSEMALKCYYPLKSFEECREIASDSISGGKAYKSFIKLIELQS